MMHFKLSGRSEAVDKISFFGKKVKIIVGIVKIACLGVGTDPTPRQGHLYYFTKQNFIAVREDDDTHTCRTIIQIAEIKSLEYDERKTMFKVTMQNSQVYKFVFKIKEVSSLFQTKLRKHLETLKSSGEELVVRHPGELKFFVGAFFDSLIQDFHNHHFAPKNTYKSLIEGCWSRQMFDPRLLPLFLREAPLKELDTFLTRGDPTLEAHCFIATCRYTITEDEIMAATPKLDNNESNTLLVLTMSKPMFSVHPRGKALSSLYNRYLPSNKFLEHFRLNRVYFVSKISGVTPQPFNYWLLPIQ